MRRRGFASSLLGSLGSRTLTVKPSSKLTEDYPIEKLVTHFGVDAFGAAVPVDLEVSGAFVGPP
jgi:hypothetical protein